jgi:DGQHR domain-containing protein
MAKHPIARTLEEAELLNQLSQPDVLSYSACLVTHGKYRFYTLTMPSDVLKDTCTVDLRAEKPISGFQRRLDIRRARDIASYIDSGFGTIPGSIVLSAQKDANLNYVRTKRTLNFKKNQRAFLILDGQHRVYEFHLAKAPLRVPVVFYNGLTKVDEVHLFMDINTKQRPVPNELLLDIKKMANTETNEEELFRAVFDLFAQRSDSPLYGLMSASEKQQGKISRVTFNAALKPTIDSFEEPDATEIYEVVMAYLHAWLIGLRAKDVPDALSNPNLFRAILLLFAVVAGRVSDRHGDQYNVENFGEVLESLFNRTKKAEFRKVTGGHLHLYEMLKRRLESGFVVVGRTK